MTDDRERPVIRDYEYITDDGEAEDDEEDDWPSIYTLLAVAVGVGLGVAVGVVASLLY